MKALSIAGLAGLASLAAQAQVPNPVFVPSLDPMVVTAKRDLEPGTTLRDAIAITRDEIDAAGPVSLGELLQRKAGIELRGTGGPGQPESLFIRGAGSAQTLVLIDGLRAGSSTAGTTALEAIPLEMIERIEVVKGPLSSLYGSDAIGGVIQIFTRHKDVPHFFSALDYGTQNDRRVSAGLSTADDSNRISLAGGYRAVDARSATNPRATFSYNPDRDGYDRGNASANLSYHFNAEHELAAQYYYSRLSNRFDATANFDDKTITTVETFSMSSTNRLASFWVSRLDVGQGSDDSVSQTGFGSSGFRTRQNQLTWQNDLALAQGALSLAYVGLDERIATDPPFPVTSRRTNSFVGVYQLKVDPHTLQANVRYDDSSQYGGRTTGALGYAYAIGEGWRALVNVGNAFKAPTFNDLYFPGFANPSLAPETAQNADVAVEYASGTLLARATAYRNQVKNLIVFQCDADFNCAPNNVAKATLTGVTLQAQGDWRTVSFKGSLDFLRPVDDATGNQLPRRAREFGSASALVPWEAWKFGAEVVAASARYDDAANTRRMGGYALVNLTASYALSRQWALTVRADNVFDKRYELAAGYNTAGASIFGGVRYSP